MSEVEKFMVTIVGKETRVEELVRLLGPLDVRGHVTIWDCNRDELQTLASKVKDE